jgi:hypothetical protein
MVEEHEKRHIQEELPLGEFLQGRAMKSWNIPQRSRIFLQDQASAPLARNGDGRDDRSIVHTGHM